MKTENKATLDWDKPTAIPWACPQCGSVRSTPDLMPRCQVCGFLESGN